MVTRRCSQRQLLLLPSDAINKIFMYCVALAAFETGVLVHVACVLSNHYHLIVTDPFAKLPKFVYILNKYVAKCVNAHRGRWENLFAAGTQASYVRLGDDQAILDKAVYTVTNPVAAHLVSRSSFWPGVCLWRPRTVVVKRPSDFFREDGPAPKKLRLTITPLPLEEPQRPQRIEELLGKRIKERESAIRAQAAKDGKKFLRRDRVLSQNPFHTPWSREPRRKLSPRLALRDKWRRIELLQRLKGFWQEHRVALAAFIAGNREAVFPAGTYKMRVQFGVTCAEC